MDCYHHNEGGKGLEPVRTLSNPSPVKKTGGNRHPCQPHTRTPLGEAISHEMVKARHLMHDLADHIFGHIVSTELGKEILQDLIEKKAVEVSEVWEAAGTRGNHGLGVPLRPHSDDVKRAIEQAFKDADLYDCDNRGTGSSDGDPGISADTKVEDK